MSSFRSLIFTRPKALGSTSRTVLRLFLEPYHHFFRARGVDFDQISDPDNSEILLSITQVLLSPQEDTPRDLIDAIFCVSELATLSEPLIEAVLTASVELPDKATTAEAAMLLYLADPAAARQLHSERLPMRARAFEFFSAAGTGGQVFPQPGDARIRVIERSLDIWFTKCRMGAGCRIFTYTQGHETWFLIRHGEYYRRESTVDDDGSAASVLFRPEKFDVLVYDSLTNEIRINAKTPKVRERYRLTFSLELFGQENYFPETNKYTLDPIRSEGPACLACIDVPGLKWVRLVKIEYALEDLEREVRSHKAEDIFNAMASRAFHMPPHARLLQATFKVRFRDNPIPRSVTIKPTNVAIYTRDDDSQLIEEWLLRRRFTERGMVTGYEQQELLLGLS